MTIDVLQAGAAAGVAPGGDFTAVIQGILDDFTAQQPPSGRVYFPKGDYVISNTLTYQGNPGNGLVIEGEIGGTRGPSGAKLIWNGPAGNSMAHFFGMNGSRISNLEFDANKKAKICLWLDADNTSGNTSASAGIVLERLYLGQYTGTDSAAVMLGHASSKTVEVSEIVMRDLVIVGMPGSAYGILAGGDGNTKNFKISGGTIQDCDVAARFSGNSAVSMHGTVIANSRKCDIENGVSTLTLIGIESEGTGQRFIQGTTGANPGIVTVQGCSWQSSAAEDDVVIAYQGALVLLGNTFDNNRGENLNPSILTVPKIQLGNPAPTATEPQAILSIGNYYKNASEDAPFYFGTTLVWDVALPVGRNPLERVVSLGDFGLTTVPQNEIVHLTNHLPSATIHGNLAAPVVELENVASVEVGPSSGASHFIVPIKTVLNFTIKAPLQPRRGQHISFDIQNPPPNSTATVHWASDYRVQHNTVKIPPGHSLATQFVYDGSHWVQLSEAHLPL